MLKIKKLCLSQRSPLKQPAMGFPKGRIAILPFGASKSFAFAQHLNWEAVSRAFQRELLCLSAICLLFLGGCANSANYQNVLNHWQGASCRDLVKKWGKPIATINLPNGNTEYMYTQKKLYTTRPPLQQGVSFINVGGTPTFSTNFTGGVSGQTIQRCCHTWFEISPNGVILSSRFQGNGCIANYIESFVK